MPLGKWLQIPGGAAAIRNNGLLVGCLLSAGPAERLSDQHWLMAGPLHGCSLDNLDPALPPQKPCAWLSVGPWEEVPETR